MTFDYIQYKVALCIYWLSRKCNNCFTLYVCSTIYI